MSEKTKEKIVQRWLQVPPPVDIKRVWRGEGPAPDHTFADFFTDGILPKLPRKTKEDLDRIRELSVLAEDSPGEWHTFTEGAYQALISALPDNLNGLAILTYLPFIDAVVNASTERPKELAAKANGAEEMAAVEAS